MVVVCVVHRKRRQALARMRGARDIVGAAKCTVFLDLHNVLNQTQRRDNVYFIVSKQDEQRPTNKRTREIGLKRGTLE